MSYSRCVRSIILMATFFSATGCASQHDEAKLQSDMVILTQKMQVLTAELKALREKQQKEQQLKVQRQMKAEKT
ncbi:MAG: hypothetical protein E6Q86_00615 [Tolumonas sp.]|nr:MAG: hypothetical protein E6Q86_00615 [Tolumonas sp.]